MKAHNFPITSPTDFLNRHQLSAYFVLTYAVSWSLWLAVQPLVLAGQRSFMALISLGIFAPALVAIALSAILNPGRGQGSRKPAVIALIITWILAGAIIITYLVLSEQMELTTRLVVVSVLTALLPAFVVSSAYRRNPGVSALLRTLVRPRGAPGYYLLALLLFPAMWLLGNLISRAMGMELPLSGYPAQGGNLLGMALLFFLYNFIYGGLSEEPGWRGFALPRLQAKLSPLVSGLLLGLLWALWHAPLRVGGVGAQSLSDTLVQWTLIVLVSVIFTWFFNRTRGSILVTALIHPAMNTTGTFLIGSIGAILLFLLFTVFVVVLDRMWRRLPADSPGVYQASTKEVAFHRAPPAAHAGG